MLEKAAMASEHGNNPEETKKDKKQQKKTKEKSKDKIDREREKLEAEEEQKKQEQLKQKEEEEIIQTAGEHTSDQHLFPINDKQRDGSNDMR